MNVLGATAIAELKTRLEPYGQRLWHWGDVPRL